jgi:sugar lactone lactonase YvrE
MAKITMKTKVGEIIPDPIIERKFNVTLHDGKDGTAEGGTKVEITGRFNFSDTSLGRVLELAEKTSRIAYQNTHRDEFLENGQVVKIMVGEGRQPVSTLEKATKLVNKLTDEQRKQLIEELTGKAEWLMNQTK